VSEVAKYDWKQLEKEYILSDHKSVSSFLKDKGIKNNSYSRNNTKGWKEKKRQHTDKKVTKTIEKVTEKEIEKEVDINTRHLRIYDNFLDILEQSFKNPEQIQYLGMPDFDKLKKMVDILEKTQKGQRLAKGLDKETDNTATQSLAEAIQKAYQSKAGDK
jgi:hypothetical protein